MILGRNGGFQHNPKKNYRFEHYSVQVGFVESNTFHQTPPSCLKFPIPHFTLTLYPTCIVLYAMTIDWLALRAHFHLLIQ